MLVSLGKPEGNQYPSRFVLINDATGRRVVLRPGGSSTVAAFGAPWILFSRDGRFALFNIVTRRWLPLACGRGCSLAGSSEIGVTLRSRWLELTGQSCGADAQGRQCGPVRYVFYNLRTHQVRHGSPQTSTRIVDLDSPTLVQQLCVPLRVPSGGSVTLEGSVGIISDGENSYLERCGSRVHVPIASGLFNACSPGVRLVCSRAVLWNTLNAPGRIDGVWLASLGRFTAELPNHLKTASWFLDAKRLYAVDQHNVLWAATL